MILTLALIGLAFALGCCLICYWWWTLPDPGRHCADALDHPFVPAPRGQHPYPELRPFPVPSDEGFDAWRGLAPGLPERLAEQEARMRLYDTGELRQLAYAGDLKALEVDAATFHATVAEAFDRDERWMA